MVAVAAEMKSEMSRRRRRSTRSWNRRGIAINIVQRRVKKVRGEVMDLGFCWLIYTHIHTHTHSHTKKWRESEKRNSE